MTWVAFSCPDAIDTVYDIIAGTWLADDIEQSDMATDSAEAPLDPAFWNAYWTIVEQSRRGVVPSDFQNHVMDLALTSNPELLAIADQNVRNHPRLRSELIRAPSPGLQPDVLRSCPDGSLGHTLYHMIVGHGYNQDVVNSRLQQMSFLPESLRRVNSRLVQMHRPWNMIAGYDTGDSHQIAYGGFQLAQFGLHHAAMVLASFATISCFQAPAGFYILLYLVSEGWRHGQATATFMDIDWESEWAYPIDTIRKRHDITPFRSVFSKNLFEVFGAPRG